MDEKRNAESFHSQGFSAKVMSIWWLHAHTSIDNSEAIHKWKRFLNLAVSAVLIAATTCQLVFLLKVNSCPEPFQEVIPFRGQCYYFHNETLTWSEAQQFCNDRKGQLMEIYSESEWSYTKKLLDFTLQNSVVWLGATDRWKKTIFRWSSTERQPSFHPPWAVGFPLEFDYDFKFSCMLLVHYNHSWINHDCRERFQFICKMFMGIRAEKQNSTDSENSVAHLPKNHTRLKTFNQEVFESSTIELRKIQTDQSLSWYGALSLCESFNMTLMSADSYAKFGSLQLNSGLNEVAENTKRPIDQKIWLGAMRHSDARLQYEFEWLNGRKEDLNGRIFHVEEKERTEKCLYFRRKKYTFTL